MTKKFIQLEAIIKLATVTDVEVRRIDAHYKDVCEAILQTNGLKIKDLDGHNIFKEYTKMMQRNVEKSAKKSIANKFEGVLKPKKRVEPVKKP
jgi:hypothetical protein